MSGADELKQLADADRAKRYPNVPGYAIPKTKIDVASTNGLTRAVMQWLQLNGHYCSRIQSQGQYNPTLKRWTKSTVRRGIGDVTTIIKGRSVMIEIKAGKDRLSGHQLKTQKQVEASGGVYLVVRSFDQFIQWYKHFLNSN